jgi:hypothetical protein
VVLGVELLEYLVRRAVRAIRYDVMCLSVVRSSRSPKLGKVLIAEGRLGVFLAWKPGRLGSDGYSTRRCLLLVFSKYLGCRGVSSFGWF